MRFIDEYANYRKNKIYNSQILSDDEKKAKIERINDARRKSRQWLISPDEAIRIINGA